MNIDGTKLKIRLISPWTEKVETPSAIFSTSIGVDEADALLCEWAPSPELFTFPRRKAWYCCEPQCQFEHLQGGTWPKIRAQLKEGEFLYHGHHDSRFRIPHITHFEPLRMNDGQARKNRAIAIVSNHGGPPSRRHPDITYRNTLITLPEVDLFGRDGWKKYRKNWYSLPKAPTNYCGEIPGDWPGEEKRNLMSQYKVCICLENMNEPGYFTEKFVEAVVAGCIPVYKATKQTAETFLKGARWIDPSNYLSPKEAIQQALHDEFFAYQAQNRNWLNTSGALNSSHSDEVFESIALALRVK